MMKGRNPLKSGGTWEVKRQVRIPLLNSGCNTAELEQLMFALVGVRGVTLDVAKHRITVRYDASQLDFQTIRVTLCMVTSKGAVTPPYIVSSA